MKGRWTNWRNKVSTFILQLRVRMPVLDLLVTKLRLLAGMQTGSLATVLLLAAAACASWC